jgi:hypothetical protein
MRKAILLLSVLLTGCGDGLDYIFDKLSGHERSTVVLARSSTTISTDPLLLRSAEPMTVVGSYVAICVVLKKDVPLAPQPVMDNYFKEKLGDARLSATLRVKGGQEFTMANASYAWRQRGLISSTEEISACLSCGCGPKPAVGSEISEISLRSSTPLPVLGIYWESNNDFDTKSN